MFVYVGFEGGLELESGLGNLLLESGDTLVGEGAGAVQVIDDNPVLDIRHYWLQPYFELQLFPNIHFGPDGTDDFQGPADFEILEGAATFELRTPE